MELSVLQMPIILYELYKHELTISESYNVEKVIFQSDNILFTLGAFGLKCIIILELYQSCVRSVRCDRKHNYSAAAYTIAVTRYSDKTILEMDSLRIVECRESIEFRFYILLEEPLFFELNSQLNKKKFTVFLFLVV